MEKKAAQNSKTCEEFTLQLLANKYAEIEAVKEENRRLSNQLDSANERIFKLENLIGSRTTKSTYVSSYGDTTFNFDCPWFKNETEDYNLMMECMNKYNEGKENETEKEEEE